MTDSVSPAPGVDLGVPGCSGAVEIGRGGFGVVYRAQQPEFHRTVAVKLLGVGGLDEGARMRFQREIAAMGSVSNHPNIVTVHQAGFTPGGSAYIVMAFEARGSLGDRLTATGPLPWADAVATGVKLAGALEAAHRAGVLHRDVKPENVLVSGYGEPKLADFGIARVEGSARTRSGLVTASIAHAAPEILAGKPSSVASDVYGLASTLYALILGRPPFSRESDESFIPMLTRVAIEPVPDLRPEGVPDDVCLVLERATAKDPAHRQTTAAAFGAELQRAQRIARVPMTAMTADLDDAAAAPPSGARALALPPAAPTFAFAAPATTPPVAVPLPSDLPTLALPGGPAPPPPIPAPRLTSAPPARWTPFLVAGAVAVGLAAVFLLGTGIVSIDRYRDIYESNILASYSYEPGFLGLASFIHVLAGGLLGGGAAGIVARRPGRRTGQTIAAILAGVGAVLSGIGVATADYYSRALLLVPAVLAAGAVLIGLHLVRNEPARGEPAAAAANPPSHRLSSREPLLIGGVGLTGLAGLTLLVEGAYVFHRFQGYHDSDFFLRYSYERGLLHLHSYVVVLLGGLLGGVAAAIPALRPGGRRGVIVAVVLAGVGGVLSGIAFSTDRYFSPAWLLVSAALATGAVLMALHRVRMTPPAGQEPRRREVN